MKIYLNGGIGEWGAVNLKTIREQIKDSTEDIEIYLNSQGGEVFEGISISNYLKSLPQNVTVHIIGLAASAASVIAMGADKVIIYDNAMIMIHYPWTFAIGNATELRKTADDLEKIGGSIKESYKAKFVGTDEELDQLLKNEEFLTADEATALGFADEIYKSEEPEETKTDEQQNAKISIMQKYAPDVKAEKVENKVDTKQLVAQFLEKLGGMENGIIKR